MENNNSDKSDGDNANLDSDIDSDTDSENETNDSEKQAKLNISFRSKKLYEQHYETFKNWCLRRHKTKTDEKVLLDYFESLSKETTKANTLWSSYGKLKTMLLLKEGIDISKNKELQNFMKKNEKPGIVNRSKFFTREEVSKFLKNAPEDEYLLHKVVLIIGLYGCLRTTELLDLKNNDIKLKDGLYHVSIPKTETSTEKSFVLNEKASAIISKYMKLRPKGMKQFLLVYYNNKCVRQVVGKRKIYCITKDIAQFLNLSDIELYRAHTIRYTAVTLLTYRGADILGCEKRGEYESNTVIEENIQRSLLKSIKKNSATKKSKTPTNDTLVLPDNSKYLYELQYGKFKDWCVKRNATEINEKLMLVYFKELSKSFKATTLWAVYSRIRPILILKENVDISKYLELFRFLKKKKKKHTPIKSKIFTREEISKFLKTAPDDDFLLHKVVLIMCSCGRLYREELLNVKVNDIKQEGNLCYVSLPKSKTSEPKSFIINEEASAIIIKYMQLRPKGIERFLVVYFKKKCIRQNLGRTGLSAIPKRIAEFLNLSDPNLYTGHSFMHNTTMLLAHESADIQTLEKRSECQNNTDVQEDNQPIQNEIDTSDLISNATNSINTEEPETLTNNLLSTAAHTYSLYEQAYEKFKDWCKQWKVKGADEKIVLTYFQTLAISFKATTLWSIYNRLKPMFLSKESIDLGKYLELQSFLKERNEQHTVKSTKVFTKEEVSAFLRTAPDDEFLLHKVVLIIGVNTHLRKTDLMEINANKIKQEGNLYHVIIPIAKTGKEKSIILNEEASTIISKYVKLRPEGMKRFFLQIRNKKCTRQNLGKNKISSIPKDIAQFLNLSDPELYTGHALRMSCHTLQADITNDEANTPTLQNNGEMNHIPMDGTMQSSHDNQNQWSSASHYNNEGIINNYNYQENLTSVLYGTLFSGVSS